MTKQILKAALTIIIVVSIIPLIGLIQIKMEAAKYEREAHRLNDEACAQHKPHLFPCK